jgi:hypothetical protein
MVERKISGQRVDISIDPRKMREFMIKLNTDTKFRAKFLKDPANVLLENGCSLTKGAQEDLEALVACYIEFIVNVLAAEERYIRCLGGEAPSGPDMPQTILP